MHISPTLKITSGSFLSDDFLVVLDERAKLRSSRLHKVRNCRFIYIVYIYWHFLTGRWPEKSVKFILRLLKNAESNADAKNIDLEDLFIKNIVVQQAPVRWQRVKFRRNSLIFCCSFNRKPVVVHIVLMVVSTLTKAILRMSRSFLAPAKLK